MRAYGKSIEQTRWRWRPALRQHRRFGHSGLLIQVGEYLVDDYGICGTGDDSDSTTTLGAGFYVDTEHPLQSLSASTGQYR